MKAFSGTFRHIFGSVLNVFGLPASHFAQALIWEPESDGLYRRRFPDEAKDLVIPSWSWASFEGTIIPFHYDNSTSGIKECAVSWWVCIKESEGFRHVGTDIGVPSQKTSLQSPACIPRPGRLFFRTELASLSLQIQNSSEAILSIISPLRASGKEDPWESYHATETHIIGTIKVDPLWLTANIERLNPPTGTTDLGFEFISILNQGLHAVDSAYNKTWIMLIESQGGIARRVGVAHISPADWAELRHIYKDIVLE